MRVGAGVRVAAARRRRPARHPRRAPRRTRSRRWCGCGRELDAVERDNRVDFLREPDLGFAWAAYRWAKGHDLDSVLLESDMTAGDFVRGVKQLLDLLGQVADASPSNSHVRKTARRAMDSLRRGVVAYSSVA